MKVLLLVQKTQRVILDRLYSGIGKNNNVDVRWLEDSEQDDLRRFFNENIDVKAYKIIILFLRFKKELRQVSFIKTIPNLVILEHDAYQNYIECKYRNKFSKYYRKLPWARILSSGAAVTQKLKKEGFDAVFVPKGYDQELIVNKKIPRDIELGFIGSIKSKTYSRRKEFLEKLAQDEKLLITRTNSGQDYVNTLNRIKYFVSADIGMGEYMIKNFEAMACGCVLFAYDQGALENRALGFKDMKNIVLYTTLEEFKMKLKQLRMSSELTESIANQGQLLAEQCYSFDKVGAKITKALQPKLRQQPKRSWWLRLRHRLGV